MKVEDVFSGRFLFRMSGWQSSSHDVPEDPRLRRHSEDRSELVKTEVWFSSLCRVV